MIMLFGLLQNSPRGLGTIKRKLNNEVQYYTSKHYIIMNFAIAFTLEVCITFHTVFKVPKAQWRWCLKWLNLLAQLSEWGIWYTPYNQSSNYITMWGHSSWKIASWSIYIGEFQLLLCVTVSPMLSRNTLNTYKITAFHRSTKLGLHE